MSKEIPFYIWLAKLHRLIIYIKSVLNLKGDFSCMIALI